MGGLTKNISRHELACSCQCGLDTMDWKTINAVQDACDHFAGVLGVDKVVLRINSAARCSDHNAAVGGSKNSWHPKCRAVDIVIDGVTPDQLYDYFDKKYPSSCGVGVYATFVHFDTRTSKARWPG